MPSERYLRLRVAQAKGHASAMADPEESVFGLSPPPRKEDLIFRAGEDWSTNACITNSHNADVVYSDGFRRAAIQLAEQVCESAQGMDVLIYPIVYLYRHHTELVLKSIIEVASDLLDRKLSRSELNKLGRHNLSELWALVRPLLDPVCEAAANPPLPLEDLQGIDSYIQQLHEHDPDGQRFRYPTIKLKNAGSRSQSPARGASLSPDLKLVNVRIFANAMEQLADYLEGIASWFSDLLQRRAASLSRTARGRRSGCPRSRSPVTQTLVHRA